MFYAVQHFCNILDFSKDYPFLFSSVVVYCSLVCKLQSLCLMAGNYLPYIVNIYIIVLLDNINEIICVEVVIHKNAINKLSATNKRIKETSIQSFVYDPRPVTVKN